MNWKLATVTDGEYKGEIVAPYCKLRFGWLCDFGGDNSHVAVIDEKYLQFWRSVKHIGFKDGKPFVEYLDEE